MRQVFADGAYSLTWLPAINERTHRTYQAILASKKRPVIIDAGANIGAASLWFSKVFPEATIVAVEPDPANVALLRMNVSGLANCIVTEAAIGSTPGFVELSCQEVAWGVRTKRSNNGVPIVTIDSIMDQFSDGVAFIAKIDIEGFERDLFSANTGWLENIFGVFVEPHDWLFPGELSSRNFQKAMARHEFELFICGENLFYARHNPISYQAN
jgi:FkbM family methyltransferase